jgi:hypothetical protein
VDQGGKNAVKRTNLPRRHFKHDEARLPLFALAYNLADSLRLSALPQPIKGCTLTTSREKPVKIGAKVVTHAKYVVSRLAEVAVPWQPFARILRWIARLCPACASGWGCHARQTDPTLVAVRPWRLARADCGNR